ncbi:MAG TPA: LamG domain-containing protein, partial [Methylomirabilota bacterium]|nr:LamG domain-containing protein [Methylomirabilota bacterium]
MKHSRRDFLKTTTTGVAGLSLGDLPPHLFAAAAPTISGSAPSPGLPAHRALSLEGLHAYADAESVLAGRTISFHVSSTVPYRLSICRLGLKVDDPAGDVVLHRFPEAPPRPQSIHPGSYVHVAKSVPPTDALTLEVWVRPWKLSDGAGLITQRSPASSHGFGVHLTTKGAVTFVLGPSSRVSADGRLGTGRWHHIVATWDGTRMALWIDARREGEWPAPDLPRTAEAPLCLGACAHAGFADNFLDGDLAMPVIYDRALTEAEIRARFAAQGLQPARGRHVLACWPLTEERGDRIHDISRHRRHGLIVNHATWMIGGPSFNAEVPRFANYDPARDAGRGHGLRLCADDLYDCRWQAVHKFGVPANARPGLHVARFEFTLNGRPHLYHTTFLVRRSPRRGRAPLLVLCATNTWRAYSGTPFAANKPELKQVWGTGGGPELPNKPPAFNFYRAHSGGQGTYQQGLRMPWPAAGPYILYGGPTDYSHLMRADRFLHVWLEQTGYDFDVAGDLDFHRDPDQLRHYLAFVINGHSEYWSEPMYRGLEKYLRGGGNVIVLSGNSLFWRVTYNDAGTILECRKVDAPGDQLPRSRRGECWHSHDGRRGGMMRECGMPAWRLIGLETLGWNNQGNPENFGPFVAELTDHFLFNRPEKTGLRSGEKFGWAGEGRMPMANGHEFDIRLSTLARLQEQPSPPGAVLPSDPPGMVRLANGIIPWKKGGAAFDYFFRPIKPDTDQGGEMIYWERPDGGRVFNAGSIGAGWALLADP